MDPAVPCKTKTSQETQRSLQKFWSRIGVVKSFTLTIPWNLAKPVKILPGIIVRRHHTDQKQMGLLKRSRSLVCHRHHDRQRQGRVDGRSNGIRWRFATSFVGRFISSAFFWFINANKLATRLNWKRKSLLLFLCSSAPFLFASPSLFHKRSSCVHTTRNDFETVWANAAVQDLALTGSVRPRPPRQS